MAWLLASLIFGCNDERVTDAGTAPALPDPVVVHASGEHALADAPVRFLPGDDTTDGTGSPIALDLDGRGGSDVAFALAGPYDDGAVATLAAPFGAEVDYDLAGAATPRASEVVYRLHGPVRTAAGAEALVVQREDPSTKCGVGQTSFIPNMPPDTVHDMDAVAVATWPGLGAVGAVPLSDGKAAILVYGATADDSCRGKPYSLVLLDRPIQAGQTAGEASATLRMAGGVAMRDLSVMDVDDDGETDVVFGVGEDLYAASSDLEGDLDLGAAELLLNRRMNDLGDACMSEVVAGDLDGDGRDDLVLTCKTSFDDPDPETTTHDQKHVALVLPSPLPRDGSAADAATFIDVDYGDEAQFGGSATMLDFDGDGQLDLAVGAPYAYNPQTGFVGGVAMFYGPVQSGTFEWLNPDVLFWGERDHANTAPKDGLTHGDFDDDGIDDLLISAGIADDGHAGAWIVYGGDL